MKLVMLDRDGVLVLERADYVTELGAAGGRLDLLLTCPDPPWAAGDRRKPKSRMLRDAWRIFARARMRRS